jgi:hypothetical protein
MPAPAVTYTDKPIPGAWRLWLRPTLADLLLALVLMLSFAAGGAGWSRLLIDGDAGLHLRVGEHILDTGAVPHVDPFSFTKPGQTWYAFEWGAETLAALAYRAWGWKGVLLGAGISLGAAFGVMFLHACARGANAGIALLFTLAAVNIINLHFYARPHLFTLLLLAVSLWLVDAHRRSPGSGWIWALVPLAAVWANLHGGFFVFFVLWTLSFAGQPRALLRRQLPVYAAAALATLANPYGWHLHAHILEILRAKWILDLVSEFQSPQFRNESLYLFMAFLFLGLAFSERLIRRGSYADLLSIWFLGYTALTSVRHATIYALAATPILAREASLLWEDLVRGRSARTNLGAAREFLRGFDLSPRTVTPWSAALLVWLAAAPSQTWPRDFPAELFPVQLATQHGELLSNSRLFATDQWNDYLVYRNYPRQRVFFDSRHNYYGEQLFGDYLAVLNAGPRAASILDRERVNAILAKRNSPLAAWAAQQPGWRLLDQTAKESLYVR